MELFTGAATFSILIAGASFILSSININYSRIFNHIKKYLISFISAIFVAIITGNLLFGLMIYVLLFSIQHLKYTNTRNKNDLNILVEYASYSYILTNTLRTGISLKQSILTVGSDALKLINSDINKLCTLVESDNYEQLIELRNKYVSPKIQLFYTCLYVRLKYQGANLDKVFLSFSKELNEYIKDIRKVDAEHAKARSTAQIIIYLISGIFLSGLLFNKYTRFYYTIPGAIVLICIIFFIVGVIFWMSSMLKRGDI